jgi:hypothetical protein
MYNELRGVLIVQWRCCVVARGRVRNGVVELDAGVSLPEGLEVTVVTPDKPASLKGGQGSHSVLDIPTFSVGAILRPFVRDDDFLEEMLEDRL